MEKYGRTLQPTDDNIIWRMCIACWIPKATDQHSEYVTVVYAKASQCYVMRTLPVFFDFIHGVRGRLSTELQRVHKFKRIYVRNLYKVIKALFLFFVLFYVFLCCSVYCLFYVVLCIVCVYMCTELLPPGGYPIAVKYIIS
jgi:hypothetical protein